jgi:hypothetical protein
VSGARRPSSRRPRSRRSGGGSVRDVWGNDDAVLDDADRVITPVVDPTALVKSLGPLPFPGGGIAQHYFEVVYTRAAALAVALAAAADVLDLPEAPTDD